MPGAPDPLYVAARGVLLDALGAVREHLDAVVLVGAQAVYIHAGEAELAIAPYTTDGDLAIDPARLRSAPLLENALTAAGFVQEHHAVGIWQRSLRGRNIADRRGRPPRPGFPGWGRSPRRAHPSAREARGAEGRRPRGDSRG